MVMIITYNTLIIHTQKTNQLIRSFCRSLSSSAADDVIQTVSLGASLESRDKDGDNGERELGTVTVSLRRR